MFRILRYIMGITQLNTRTFFLSSILQLILSNTIRKICKLDIIIKYRDNYYQTKKHNLVLREIHETMATQIGRKACKHY